MKNIYYTITKQLENIDGFEEVNGYKDVNVYEIRDNKLIKILGLELVNAQTTEEEILDELPEEFNEVKLIQL